MMKLLLTSGGISNKSIENLNNASKSLGQTDGKKYTLDDNRAVIVDNKEVKVVS